jgi:uncharacterized protein
MRIVIDTNCFLAILPKKSTYRPIFDAYRQGRIELAVSSEILDEYAEIFEQKMTPQISENILELIMKQSNSIKTEIYYRWELIKVDLDDNKFVDTAISSDSDYIVTVDRHYNILKEIPFPRVGIISLDDFMNILNNS